MSLKTKSSERVIDLDGPDGNAYVLLGLASGWARQLGLDEEAVTDWMKKGDYVNLLAVFDHYFGRICTLQSSNQALLDKVAAVDLSMTTEANEK
jgi:hypothetical protein